MVESGVPQGTVRGPLIFLCHIKYLLDVMRSQVHGQWHKDQKESEVFCSFDTSGNWRASTLDRKFVKNGIELGLD